MVFFIDLPYTDTHLYVFSLGLALSLTKKSSKGVGWINFDESISYEDLYTTRSVVSTFYSITVFHSFETSSSTFTHHSFNVTFFIPRISSFLICCNKIIRSESAKVYLWKGGKKKRVVVRKKILHYHQLYINRPDPVAFMSVGVDTSGPIYDDFSRLLFLHVHRKASALVNEISEESGQFLFLRVTYFTKNEGRVRLILAKTSVMRISILLDLSSRPFVPLPCFIRFRHPTTLLTPPLFFFLCTLSKR